MLPTINTRFMMMRGGLRQQQQRFVLSANPTWIFVASYLLQQISMNSVFLCDAFTPRHLWRKRDVFSIQHNLPPLSSIVKHQQHQHQQQDNGKRRGRLISRGYACNSTLVADTTTSLVLPYSATATQDTIITQEQEQEEGERLPVLYTNDPKEINRWLTKYVSMDGCILGFDTESVPNFPGFPDHLQGRPVLVQLATIESSIVIPLTNKYGKYYTSPTQCIPLLGEILRDDKIIKCGVGIEQDMLELKRFVPGLKDLKAKSRLDLHWLTSTKNKNNQIGLKSLTRIVLGRSLSKPKRITISNWSRNVLTDEQIAYAARDAWAGAAIVRELGRKDPNKFGFNPLREILKTQPDLNVLEKCTRQRRSAKRSLARFHKQQQKNKIKSMPPDVKQRVEKLKQLLKETDLEYFSAIETLGFIKDEQPTSL